MGRPRGWSRLYVRNWRVRTKLAAVLLVPSVAFLAVGGFELYSTFRTSQVLDGYTDRVSLSRDVTALVHQLQQERDRTAGALVATDRTAAPSTAVGQFSALTASDWRATNAAAEAYRKASGRVTDSSGATFQDRVEAAATALDELPELRTAAAEGQLPGDTIFDGYSRMIAALLRVLPDGAPVRSDGGTAPSVRGLADLAQAKELQSQVRGRLQAVAQTGAFAYGEYQTYADLRARRAAALGRFRSEAEAGQLAAYERAAGGRTLLAAAELERKATDGAKLSFDAEEWWPASTTQIEAARTAELRIADTAVRAATRFSASAAERTRLVAALVTALLLAALAASFVVGRSIAGSLRRLRRRALVAAQHDLPEAIRVLSAATGTTPDLRIDSTPVDSADEIGEVATAFDAVHHSAIRLATEQAALRRDVSAMFVNLARRSQVLVGRQLVLLDELEADEQDPDRLSRFFALDHLATRMRRNDENLLVLAASESHRLWREPVPLSKVLLGAVAETEQYERVQAHGPDDVVVTGHVVPDLLHLLAELLDNATAFSPPSAPVQLSARMARGAAGSEAIVTVEDTGMGMTQSMLADANLRLAEPAGIDVAVSERMGHFVVSRLAARHGMRVELQGAAGGGVTATVWLPAALLAPAPPQPEKSPDLEDTQQLPRPALDTVEETTADLTPATGAGTTPDGTDVPDATDATDATDSTDAEDPSAEPDEPATVAANAGQPAPADALPRRSTGALPRRTPGTAMPAPVSPGPAGAGQAPALVDVSGGWWSGDGSGWRGATPPASPTGSGTSAAGLPVRVPMASRPEPRTTSSGTVSTTTTGTSTTTTGTSTSTTVAPPPAEPDEVSDTLARFHSGIRRADDEDPATCNS